MAIDDEETGAPSGLSEAGVKKLDLALRALDRQLVKNTAQQELLNQAIKRGTSTGREYQKVVDDELALIDTQVDKLRIQLEQQLAMDAQYKAEGIPLTQERIRETRDLTEATGQQIDALKEEGRVLKTVTGAAEKFVSTLTGVNSGLAQTITSTLTSGKAFGKFAKSVLKAGAVSRGLIGLGLKMAESSIAVAVAVDKQTEAVRKTLGVGKQYDSMLESQIRSLYHYGVGADETAKAFNSLYISNRQFVKLGEAQKKSLVASTAQLAELGASTDTTAEITNNLTKGLGASATEVEGISQYLLNVSDAMGRPVSAVAEDFKSASTRLAFYGMRMKKVFEGLEAQSMATGLSVDKLLDVVGDPFDTFEGSAQAVGRLNAILGGPYLNSIDMLNASEEQRVRMLRQSIKLAGISFDQLGKFEQLTIASALGTDVDTAMKMLRGMNSEERRRVREQRQLAKAAREAQGTLTKMKLIFFELATTMEPLMDGLSLIVDRFSDVVRLYTQALEKLPEKKQQQRMAILTTGATFLAAAVLAKFGLRGVGAQLIKGARAAGGLPAAAGAAKAAPKTIGLGSLGPKPAMVPKPSTFARIKGALPWQSAPPKPPKIPADWKKTIDGKVAADKVATQGVKSLGDEAATGAVKLTKLAKAARFLKGTGVFTAIAAIPTLLMNVKDYGAAEGARATADEFKYTMMGGALGASAGVIGGPFAEVTIPVGAAVGLGIGGLMDIAAMFGILGDDYGHWGTYEKLPGGGLVTSTGDVVGYPNADNIIAAKTRAGAESIARDLPGDSFYGNAASNRMDELQFGKMDADAQALLIKALNKNTESNAQSRNGPAQEVNAVFKVDRSMAQAIVKLGLPAVGYVS